MSRTKKILIWSLFSLWFTSLVYLVFFRPLTPKGYVVNKINGMIQVAILDNLKDGMPPADLRQIDTLSEILKITDSINVWESADVYVLYSDIDTPNWSIIIYKKTMFETQAKLLNSSSEWEDFNKRVIMEDSNRMYYWNHP